MEKHTAHEHFDVSKIRFLKFINEKATDPDTIYTALNYAATLTRKKRQETCFVTFDQPLYYKAREIIAGCNDDDIIKTVVVRLGGFHMLMSFLGAIGVIMEDSGLKELWSKVYAEKSVDNMLNGHSYARAVRAHFLTLRALGKIILDDFDIEDSHKTVIKNLLSSDEAHTPLEILESSLEMENVLKSLKDNLESIRQRGFTARLWIPYVEMVLLVQAFIRAERSANFSLHIASVYRMIPYFHASAHNNYAKSPHLYLQDMHALRTTMDPIEFERFTKAGYFTIRRTDKFWSGIWSDMTIEQTLMRLIKITGGIFPTRGSTPSVATNLILSLPSTTDVCDSLEKFVHLASSSSEQHKSLRNASVQKDHEHIQIFYDWLRTKGSFLDKKEIVLLSSGVVGDDTIDCWMAKEKGKMGVATIIGSNYGDVTVKRTFKIRPISTMGSQLKINDDAVPINTTLLLQRAIASTASVEDLASYFNHEMAPVPLSLFYEIGLRKVDEEQLFKIFPEADSVSAVDCWCIIDGDELLDFVDWRLPCTFGDLYNLYKTYVEDKYGNCTIVFKRYVEDVLSDPLPHKPIQRCMNMDFNDDTPVTVKKEVFFYQ